MSHQLLERHAVTRAAKAPQPEAEALIREVRRRARRRRLTTAAVVVLLGGLGGGTYALWARSAVPPSAKRPPSGHGHLERSGLSGATSTGAVTPEQPISLAVSPNGDLFIADRGRNEILKRTLSGRFRVVAGTGVAGLSGDGGPAARAEVDSPDNLVSAPDGTLYFTQPGRYRAPMSSAGGMLNTVIREITPKGTIFTVAGRHPSCRPGPARSTAAESALFYGASLSAPSNGALVVDARLCSGNTQEKGLGPNLLLTASGRFVKDVSDAFPPVASVNCGSGVAGPGFHAFSCSSGDGGARDGHERELLVVRSNGASATYPDYRGGELAEDDKEVIATYNGEIVRVTSTRLLPLLRHRRLLNILGGERSTGVLDIGGLAIGPHGAIYFVASSASHLGCKNEIVVRTAAGALRQIWSSAPSRDNVCP